MSAAGHASDFSDSEENDDDDDVVDDDVDDEDGGHEEKDDAGSLETDLDEATGPGTEAQGETAVDKVEQIIALCEKSLKVDPDKGGLATKSLGAEHAYSGGVGGEHKTGAATDDVPPSTTSSVKRDRFMTAQTEDTTSPSSQRPSTSSNNSPGTDASAAEEPVSLDAVAVKEKNKPASRGDDGRASEIANVVAPGDSDADAALPSSAMAFPCTPLPRKPQAARVATVTPNPSPAGSLCPGTEPTPEKALEQPIIPGGHRVGAALKFDERVGKSGEAVPSLAPAPVAGGHVDSAVELGPGGSGGRSEGAVLEVGDAAGVRVCS